MLDRKEVKVGREGRVNIEELRIRGFCGFEGLVW